MMQTIRSNAGGEGAGAWAATLAPEWAGVWEPRGAQVTWSQVAAAHDEVGQRQPRERTNDDRDVEHESIP